MYLNEEDVIFLSDKPFVKYESARFDGGIYRTSDPEEIKLLMKSKFYGSGFRRLEDISPELALNKGISNEPALITAETVHVADDDSDPDSDIDDIAQGIMEKKTVPNINYRTMAWPQLRAYARNAGLAFDNKATRNDILALLDANNN